MRVRWLLIIGASIIAVAMIAIACSSAYRADADPLDAGDAHEGDDASQADAADAPFDVTADAPSDAGTIDGCAIPLSLWCFQDDFEGDPSLSGWQSSPVAAGGATLDVERLAAFAGGGGLRAHLPDNATNPQAFIDRPSLPLFPPAQVVDVRFRLRTSRQPAPITATGDEIVGGHATTSPPYREIGLFLEPSAVWSAATLTDGGIDSLTAGGRAKDLTSWTCIEWMLDVGTPGNVTLWVDGIQALASPTASNLTNDGEYAIRLGISTAAEPAAIDFDYDDVVMVVLGTKPASPFGCVAR
jgi:hypothetical protein